MKKTIVLTLLAAVCLSGCGPSAQVDHPGSGEQTVKLFANFNPADPTESDRAFIKQIEKATGVKLEFDIPPSTSYNERLQLMLASGEYPDVILFPSTGDQGYLNAVSQGILIPVNEYLKDAPNIKKYTYDVSWDTLKTKNDDNIYGIPRSTLARYDGVLIRQDWLDRVGLSAGSGNAVTISEFEEILKRFTEDDPDRNGKKDTVGYLMAADSNKTLSPLPVITAAFGCLGWQKSLPGEKYEYMHPAYSRVDTAYKDSLAFTRRMYMAGYIDPNAPNMTALDAREKFTKGTVAGMVSEFSGYLMRNEKDLKKNVPDASLNYLYVKNERGEIKGSIHSTGFWGHFSVTMDCKNPEAVIKVFDYMLSDEGWNAISKGYEGLDYTVVNGDRQVVEDKTKIATWTRSFLRRNNDVDFFAGGANWTPEERERVEPIVNVGINAMVFSQDRGFTPPAAKEVNYINYSKTMSEVVTKIITGNADVSEYDKALDGWYKNGGEEYVKQMNDYIKTLSKEQ